MLTSREELAWAAGVFEGEGSFYENRNNGQKVATMQMTDEDVVRDFHAIVGVGHVFGPYSYQQKDGSVRKPSWRWTAGSFEDCQAFIAMVWAYLHARRQEKARSLLVDFRQNFESYLPCGVRN